MNKKLPPLEPKDRIYLLARWDGMRPLDNRVKYAKADEVMQTIANHYIVEIERLMKSEPLSDGSYTVTCRSRAGGTSNCALANVKPWPKGKS